VSFPPVNLANINLLVSHRVTHQLVTRVFAILLQEIIDFDNIQIDDQLDAITSDDDHDEKFKEYINVNLIADNPNAINLEVWITPDYHVMLPEKALEGHSLSHDLTRYGLFVSAKNGTASKEYSFTNFQTNGKANYNKVIQEFVLESDVDAQFSFLRSKASKVFIPRQCASTSEPCAVVLTSHRGDTGFFEEHIEKLNLKLSVYFMNEKLKRMIDQLGNVIKNSKQSSKKFLIFHWTPSEIINQGTPFQQQAVTMPKCELYSNNSLTGCKYEVIPVSTYYGENIKDSYDILEVLRNMDIHSLNSLLSVYAKYENEIEKAKIGVPKVGDDMLNVDMEMDVSTIEEFYNRIACEWLRENQKVYSFKNGSWIVMPLEVKEIALGGM